MGSNFTLVIQDGIIPGESASLVAVGLRKVDFV